MSSPHFEFAFPPSFSCPCPLAMQIVFGCQDGKVRLAQLKTAKAVVLYSTGSYVVSMCSRYRGW